ncbi:MAG: hypothetical protein JWM16_2567 [Verrucomicrobiales bacterium]|nr:hypothetical protein [Verrucomicrobiales bacterium]
MGSPFHSAAALDKELRDRIAGIIRRLLLVEKATVCRAEGTNDWSRAHSVDAREIFLEFWLFRSTATVLILVVKLTLLTIIFLLSVCLAGQGQTAPDILPRKFAFWCGGMIKSKSVEWNGKELVYREAGVSSKATNQIIRPTKKQWQEFWTATEKVQLSKWQRLYEDKSLTDGWVWEIEVVRGKEKIQSCGCNAFPNDANAAKTVPGLQSSKRFNAFLSALEKLTGLKL